MKKARHVSAEVSAPHLSVVIAVSSRFGEPGAVYKAYHDALGRGGERSLEFIYVLDGPHQSVEASLLALRNAGEPISVIPLWQKIGEAACLREGIQRAQGEIILFLTPYLQVDPASLPMLVAELEKADLVAAVRDRRADSPLNRIRGWGLRQLGRLAGSRFADPGCLVRVCHRYVLEEVSFMGEQHRFLPLLAERAGFSVRQIVVPQAQEDRSLRAHRPFAYIGTVLDHVAIAFLLKFTQKPFRFFGTAGFISGLLGIAVGLYLVYERAVFSVSIADRPMLLLAVLLVVLGVQIGAVGLIAEIIIFTRSQGLPTYRVREVVERDPSEAAQAQAKDAPASKTLAGSVGRG